MLIRTLLTWALLSPSAWATENEAYEAFSEPLTAQEIEVLKDLEERVGIVESDSPEEKKKKIEAASQDIDNSAEKLNIAPDPCKAKKSLCDEDGLIPKPAHPLDHRYVGAGLKIDFPWGSGPTLRIVPHRSFAINGTYGITIATRSLSAGAEWYPLQTFGLRTRITPFIQGEYTYAWFNDIPKILGPVVAQQVDAIGLNSRLRGMKTHFITVSGGLTIYTYVGVGIGFSIGKAFQIGKASGRDDFYSPSVENLQFLTGSINIVFMPKFQKTSDLKDALRRGKARRHKRKERRND